MNSEDGTRLVEAARTGDTGAQDQLVAAYLPLVYNIVGRALKGHADVDDVVQETMLRALYGLDGLRDPARFRSWLIAIAMSQIRHYWQQKRRDTPIGGLGEVHEVAAPEPDFVDVTIVRLGLEGQRKEVVEATRWLDDDQQNVLSLWWLETAGELTRAELAAALELSPQHAAVRVRRIKEQLEIARVVVRALATAPRCAELERVLALWDGVPSALWRKRIARHAGGCPYCAGRCSTLVPAEGLLAMLGLVPISGALLWWRASDVVALGIVPAGGATAAVGAPPADFVVAPVEAHANAGRHRANAGRHRAHRRQGKGGKAAAAAALVMAMGGATFLVNVPRNEGKRVEGGAERSEPLTDLLPSATPPVPERKTTEPTSSFGRHTRGPVIRAPHTASPSPRSTKTAPPSTRPTPSPTTGATLPANPRMNLVWQLTTVVKDGQSTTECTLVRSTDQPTTAAQRKSDNMTAARCTPQPDGTGTSKPTTTASP
ncbi:RNA polymerase sigma factor [Streptomyces tubercidicus]|uniref:RNA polymerase sigma factor n=1 Tax=Streptomyces tubercidicus TaxID=47759 RepID=UPI0034674780